MDTHSRTAWSWSPAPRPASAPRPPGRTPRRAPGSPSPTATTRRRPGRSSPGSRARGGRALAVRLDLEDLGTVEEAVNTVVEEWGGVDVLVANAVRWGGDGPPDPSVRFEDVPLDEWQAMIGANLIGAAAQVRAVLPGMRARGWGRIVLISSSVAEEGVPGPGPYGTAKSGLYGLARSLAWEAGRDGILVNVVAPGFTLTDSRPPLPASVTDKLAAGTPTRRLSDADDVARLVLFLGSGANGNLTGEVVRDGSSAARVPRVGR